VPEVFNIRRPQRVDHSLVHPRATRLAKEHRCPKVGGKIFAIIADGSVGLKCGPGLAVVLPTEAVPWTTRERARACTTMSSRTWCSNVQNEHEAPVHHLKAMPTRQGL
jgi:hypothetical protein